VDETQFSMGSRALMRRRRAQNIQARPLWQPVHLSPAQRGAGAQDCSVVERVNREGLSLPSSVGLKQDDQQRVIHPIEVKENLSSLNERV